MSEERKEVNQEMAQKREVLEPQPGDKRNIRQEDAGKFTEDQVDVSKLLSAGVEQTVKKK